MFLIQLLDLYSLVVLGSVVVSWLQLPPSNPIVTLLGTMTEPLLAPIRRILPDMSGLDFSPLVLLFGLRLLRGVLLTATLGQ